MPEEPKADPLHPGPEETHTVSHDHLSHEAAMVEIGKFLATPAIQNLLGDVKIQDRIVDSTDEKTVQKRRKLSDDTRDARDRYIATSRQQIDEEVKESLDEPVSVWDHLNQLEDHLKGALSALDLARKAYHASHEPAETW